MPLSSYAQQQQQQQREQANNPPPDTTSANTGQGQPAPQNSKEWDYKSSPVNQKGEALPAGAKSWTPFGQPYFGPGLSGTIKRYTHALMGSPTGQEDGRWEKFLQLTESSNFWNDPTSKEFKQDVSELGAGIMGKSETKEQDWNQIREGNARLKQIKDQYGDNPANMPTEVRREYEEIQSFWNDPGKALGKVESATSGSLLSPLLKFSKVGVQAVMDVLSEASIKFEQAQGVTSAMRDFAQENSQLPSIASDIDRQKEMSAAETEEFWDDPRAALNSESAQEIGNIASRLLLPILNTWDAFRFWTAPGTVKEKIKVAQDGWDAGRILYSQAIKPSLLAEYKRRAAAGEDPQLLAQELQNPWAEAVGQAILDPLNVIGAFAKGVKVAGMLDDATDAVRGGSLGDEAAELLADAGRTPLGETAAADRMGKFDDLLVKNVDRLENQRLTVDFNKGTSYSPSGLRVRETKVVQTVSNVVTSSIMRNGGSADDVADYFHLLSRATSADKAARLEAWDQIMTMSKRFGLGRYPFSDDVLETGVLLRNLVEDGDLLTTLKRAKGDLAETAKILDSTFKRAVEKQIPTYTEVKNLAKKFETGADTGKQAEKAAQAYKGIKSKALWNLHEGKLGDFKTAVNSTLGKFFFAQPGFVSRNASNNMMTMLVDQGFSGTAKSFYRDGKYWSIAEIDADLMKYFGGKLPAATGGISSLSQAENASTVVSRLNEAVESGFAKRIYWKNFRDTMDKFMSPGVALPKRDEFKALGMTDEGIDHFLHVLKNESYGNVEQAITKYSEKFGDNGLLDVWKRWNGSVSADEMKGLTEIGITKEIDQIVSTAKTPAEIRDRISKLKKELVTRVNSAADNPVGVNRERKGFEFMEGIGKAEKEGLLDADGTNRLNILIEQSERASDELMQAIGKARDRVTDPVLREQFGVMEQAFSAERRGSARTVSQQLTDTAWELTRKSKKSTGLQAEALWNQSILAKRGPAPKGLTPERFRNELWQATRNDVSNNWETYFAEGFDRLSPLVDNLTEQFPDLAPLFAKSQKSSAELNMYRTAIYRDGKIFYSQPPQSVTELANRYGVSSATGTAAEGRAIPQDKRLLDTINKYSDKKFKTLEEAEADLATVERALKNRAAAKGVEVKAAKGTTQPELTKAPANIEDAKELPRSELPPEVSQRIADEARRLSGELFGGEAGKRTAQATTGSTNVSWYRELYEKGMRKPQIDKALDKIIMDAGADKGATVEKVKDFILDTFRYGDKTNGIPPDLKALKALGADDKILREALDDYNDITRQEKTLEELIGGTDEAAQLSDEAAELAPDTSQAYYDDAGNLIEPQNPEVQIAPPYVDGSTPIPGQMWKENADGIINALNKVESHMLDNFGMQAIDKLDGSQLKALKGILKDSSGRITEGIAIADKIGKEWRDFALLPYGETKNFDLALSYAFPYQFWYSRSYSNWMKRVATDPQVIANYARIKESMSKINKDSPEWWRYNVEIPSHFLGLPNEHPMSFNLEANIWPLYGLTGTDFNDPQKRQNWMTATVDDMGKFGPSIWAPMQWAIALAYRAQGETELAQAWAGRVIPQTATIKAASSYFGQPVELDPMVQMFSGEGLMDFQAMDKYERNRVGRALTSMVQNGEITEEQMMEISRLQEGPAWDEAVKRATQLRAPGQISSYFLGVGMKARTEEDRITDEFYQEYYRLQNLNEADLISPTDYQTSWDGLRERYPFMDALLLSRKAGPDRDRAYLYNVLGRIPPGQASEMYKLVGIDPKLAQKFYDSKGNLEGMSESERDRLMAAGVDLGAMLAIPQYATKQDWNAARSGYKDIQERMKQTFGEGIQDQIDDYFGIADKDDRERFLRANPQVQTALSWQNEQVVNNEDVYEFYGGISALEKFHKGKVFDQLEQKFGADISDKFDEYYDLQVTDPAGAKRFYRQHPELKAYNKEKKILMEQALRNIVEFGSKLPEAEPPPQLTGNEPQTVGQENIQQYAQQTAPDFAFWQSELPEVSTILSAYWADDEPLPAAVTRNLDYLAPTYGYQDGEEMLQSILISMNR
jgi:hypothetical protein